MFGIVTAHDEVALLAEIGVTVRCSSWSASSSASTTSATSAPVALATGLGQLGFTIVFGFLIIV